MNPNEVKTEKRQIFSNGDDDNDDDDDDDSENLVTDIIKWKYQWIHKYLYIIYIYIWNIVIIIF